jgi:hypothetical protein
VNRFVIIELGMIENAHGCLLPKHEKLLLIYPSNVRFLSLILVISDCKEHNLFVFYIKRA